MRISIAFVISMIAVLMMCLADPDPKPGAELEGKLGIPALAKKIAKKIAKKHEAANVGTSTTRRRVTYRRLCVCKRKRHRRRRHHRRPHRKTTTLEGETTSAGGGGGTTTAGQPTETNSGGGSITTTLSGTTTILGTTSVTQIATQSGGGDQTTTGPGVTTTLPPGVTTTLPPGVTTTLAPGVTTTLPPGVTTTLAPVVTTTTAPPAVTTTTAPPVVTTTTTAPVVTTTQSQLAACENSRQTVTISPTNQDQVVNQINIDRSLIANGQVPNYPTGAHMATVSWDPTLADIACQYNNECDFVRNPCDQADGLNSYGFNLYTIESATGFTDPSQVITAGINSWFDENSETTAAQINPYTSSCPNGPPNDIADFSLMIDERVNGVGCCIIQFPSGTSFVSRLFCIFSCNNVVGQNTYQTGPTGSACTTGLNPLFPALCSTNEAVAC